MRCCHAIARLSPTDTHNQFTPRPRTHSCTQGSHTHAHMITAAHIYEHLNARHTASVCNHLLLLVHIHISVRKHIRKYAPIPITTPKQLPFAPGIFLSREHPSLAACAALLSRTPILGVDGYSCEYPEVPFLWKGQGLDADRRRPRDGGCSEAETPSDSECDGQTQGSWHPRLVTVVRRLFDPCAHF